MVQRKVFEQLKGFMVRITFNKKYIFAGLTKEPQAGRNSGKAPIPLGGARGEQGEGSLCSLAPQRHREGMLGILASGKRFGQAAGLSLRDAGKCPIQTLGAMFAISQKI